MEHGQFEVVGGSEFSSTFTSFSCAHTGLRTLGYIYFKKYTHLFTVKGKYKA